MLHPSLYQPKQRRSIPRLELNREHEDSDSFSCQFRKIYHQPSSNTNLDKLKIHIKVLNQQNDKSPLIKQTDTQPNVTQQRLIMSQLRNGYKPGKHQQINEEGVYPPPSTYVKCYSQILKDLVITLLLAFLHPLPRHLSPPPSKVEVIDVSAGLLECGEKLVDRVAVTLELLHVETNILQALLNRTLS